MMDIIVTGRLPYGTKVLKDGDPLRVSNQDGEVLIALGKAKRKPVETKDMAADDGDDAPRAKRKYVRRDLVAE